MELTNYSLFEFDTNKLIFYFDLLKNNTNIQILFFELVILISN